MRTAAKTYFGHSWMQMVMCIALPAAVSCAMTLAMYLGEMILLNGHLYILGTGFLFQSIPGIVLSAADILVIAASGGVTAGIFALLQKRKSIAERG